MPCGAFCRNIKMKPEHLPSPARAGLFFCCHPTYILIMQKLVLLLALLCAPTFAQAWPGDVLTVHDGDTVRVQPADGAAVSIRVYGVDCPELGQPYGAEARNMTAHLLNGRQVEIIPAQTRKSYRREVAGVVLLDDMIVLQDALISAGLAWVDNRFCRMAVCDLWRQHQADAKAARRGLWADDNPIPPWTWRRMPHKRAVPTIAQ